MLDYPTAWRLVKQTEKRNHHEQCSFRTQNGGMLCDCAVVEGIRVARDELLQQLADAQRERDEAREKWALFKRQLGVQEERTASWHVACDAAERQIAEFQFVHLFREARMKRLEEELVEQREALALVLFAGHKLAIHIEPETTTIALKGFLC